MKKDIVLFITLMLLNLLAVTLNAQSYSWQFMTADENEFYSSPALGQDASGNWRLYIGGQDGYFYSINVANGQQVWRKKSIYDPEDPNQIPEDVFNASPAVNQYFSPGHIYCGGYEGELYCFTTGSATRWLWRYPDSAYESTTGYEFGSSVAFKDNRLYVGCDDGYLYALQDNCYTCSRVWRFYTGSEIWSSPAIDASGNVYFGDDSGYVRCLNANGTQLWRRKVGFRVATSPALTASRVYVGTDDGYLCALNINTGMQEWRYIANDVIRSSPVIGADSTIYFGCNDGKLYALSPAGTLKPGFPIQLSNYALSSTPAIATDGTIVVYAAEDIVYGVRLSGTIDWQVLLPGYGKGKAHKNPKFQPFHPSPTIGPNGSIYVASVVNGVYAIFGYSNALTMPNGGEIWPGGSNQTIKWQSRYMGGVGGLANTAWPKFRHDIRNTGNISGSKSAENLFVRYRLLLSRTGGSNYPDTIAHNIAPTESTYNWLVPTLNLSTCRVKVQGLDGVGSVISEDASDANFTIETYPTIVSPNGGEILFGGSQQIIRWRTIGTGFSQYRLLLSRNSGTSYPDTIAHNIASTETTYNWLVPNLNFFTCRLMVQILAEDGAVISYDECDGDFMIMTMAVDEVASNTFFSTALQTVRPNPITNNLAQISFSLAQSAKVALKIYNTSGKLIKTIVNTNLQRGIYNYIWDGRDEFGHKVAEGIYFYILETTKQSFMKKMVLIR